MNDTILLHDIIVQCFCNVSNRNALPMSQLMNHLIFLASCSNDFVLVIHVLRTHNYNILDSTCKLGLKFVEKLQEVTFLEI